MNQPRTHQGASELPPPRELLVHAADALASYAGEIEDIGAMLCGNAAFVDQHLGELQAIDRLAQSLSQLALVLRAPNPDQAVASITIGSLQERLSKRPG